MHLRVILVFRRGKFRPEREMRRKRKENMEGKVGRMERKGRERVQCCC
jgi:thioredoxin reductase